MSNGKYKDGGEKTGVDNVGYTATEDDVHVAVTPTSASVISESLPKKKNAEITIDKRFGYGPFKPRALQFLNRVWILVIWLMIFCFLEGFAINGIANAGLPAIERQFQLTSSKSSLIPASQDIGALILILFVSFIGGRNNKAVWIATGSVVMAVGSFIFIIPHLAETYKYEGEGGPTGPQNPCTNQSAGGGPPCESEGEKYVGVFMLAQIIHGIGFTPVFTLGTVYLDDNSNPNTAALYVGICYAATAIGVASGFFAGGQFIEKLFVEFDRVDQDTLGFGPRDTRWVGAWWIGFVVTAVAFVVIAIPIFGYPKYMPGNEKAEETEEKLRSETDTTLGKLVKQMIISFLKAFLRLIKNPTFIFVALGGCTESLIIFGVSAFSFKYLLEMYSLPFDQSGYLLGGLILVGSVGMFLGGFLIRILKLEIVGMLRLNVGATLLAAILGIAYLAKCPEVNLAGHRVTYPGDSLIDTFTSDCNSACSCEGLGFNPVCGKDQIVYYSSCHAGCNVPPEVPMGDYSNCSCIAASLNISVSANATASFGRCPDGCTNIKILAPCLFIMMIAVLTATTPGSMATLRCVEEDIRPFALGVSWMLLRLLGSIPGPVLIGSVIDGACELWQGSACGGSGVCMLYNKDELSRGVMLWWVLVSAVTSILFFIASLFAGRGAKGSFDISK